MRFTHFCLSLLIALLAAAGSFAQSDPFDVPQPTPPSRTSPPTIPSPTPPVAPLIDKPLKLVSLTILLVEAPSSKLPDDKTPEELLPIIAKLAGANELTGHTRLQLATADGQQGFVQNGEQVSVPQASTRIDVRVVQRSVTRQSVGTTVRCTPRVVEGDKIVVTLEIEESRLVPVARPMGAPEEPAIELPPSVQNAVARTVITIPNGRTVLVGGQQTTTPDGKSRQSLILVTAKVSE